MVQWGLAIFECWKAKKIFLSLCLNNTSMAALKTQRLAAFPVSTSRWKAKAIWNKQKCILVSDGILNKVARLPLNAFINKSSHFYRNKYRNIS